LFLPLIFVLLPDPATVLKHLFQTIKTTAVDQSSGFPMRRNRLSRGLLLPKQRFCLGALKFDKSSQIEIKLIKEIV